MLPNVPAGHKTHDCAPADAEKEPAGHALHVEPLRKKPALHVAVPTNTTPVAVMDHQSLANAGPVIPAAKQRFLWPMFVPSKLPLAYEKDSTFEAAERGCVSVTAVQLKQPASDGVTAPAGHTPKKPPKYNTLSALALAPKLTVIALYAVDAVEAGAQNAM